MSEFGDLLREAFAGAERFDAHPGRADLERAVSKFEARDRTVRVLVWSVVTLATVPAAWAAYGLFAADDGTSTRMLVIQGVVLLFAMQSIAFMKAYLAEMRNHLDQMKELKRVQMLLLEESGRAAAREG